MMMFFNKFCLVKLAKIIGLRIVEIIGGGFKLTKHL